MSEGNLEEKEETLPAPGEAASPSGTSTANGPVGDDPGEMADGDRAGESADEEAQGGGLMSRFVAGLLEKTVRQSGFRNEVDRYIDGKRDQTLQAARDEADGFLEDWLARIERRIDHKLVEIEVKIDEQIEKELRAKIWILIMTLLTVVGMSVVSLAYFWFKESSGFSG